MVNTPWGTFPEDAHVNITIQGKDYIFLIDTGSQITILAEKIYKQLKGLNADEIQPGPRFVGAGGNSLNMTGSCLIDLTLGGHTFKHKC